MKPFRAVYSEGDRRRDTSMKAVSGKANPMWKMAVENAFRWCAKELDCFTTDDVWERLEDRHPGLTTDDNRAMGPIVWKLKHGKVIRLARRADRKSRRAVCHSRMVKVYRAY